MAGIYKLFSFYLCILNPLSLSHLFFIFTQTEEYPLHLQHSAGSLHLEGVYRPLPDGQKHLVLRGQPLFQVPLLLPRIQHLNQLSLPQRLEPEMAALAFSCQPDRTSETDVHFRTLQNSPLLWISRALYRWGGCSWVKPLEGGRNKGLLAMNYLFSLEKTGVHSFSINSFLLKVANYICNNSLV